MTTTQTQGEDVSRRSGLIGRRLNALFHLGVLLAMVGGGSFSLFLAGHLSFWTPLWLPAGVALVAALSLGNRSSIAIGLGSFISYWFMFHFETDAGLRLMSSFLGALASVTGTLMAAGLIRRRIQWPNPLDSIHQLSQFFLAAVLVGPLVTGTLSATGWFLIGVVSQTSIGFTCLNHTLAHAVGTSMLVPILLLWVGRPKEVWLNRKGVVAGTMAIAAAASLCLLTYASRMATMQMRSQFDDEASQLTAALERELVSRTEAIESVRALWESSEEVTREEFKEFTRRSLARFTDVEFIAWAPQIAEMELDYLKSSLQEEAVSMPMQSDLSDLFEVHSPPVLAQAPGTGTEPEAELSPGQAIPFPLRYPIFYLEPLNPNANWLGADLSSYPPFLKTAFRSEEAKAPWISPPFRESKSGNTRILVCLGVRESPAYPSQKRITQKAGMAIAVLSFNSLFNESIRSLGRKPAVSIRISALEDESNPNSMAPFFQTGADLPSAAPPAILSDLNREVFIGGQRWFIELFPAPASFEHFLLWNITGVQVGVTMITSLLAAMLLIVSRFTLRIESEVSDRTRELHLSEENLIAAQKATEEASRTLRQFFQVSLDMMCIAGTDGYFKQVNPAFTGILGYEGEVLLMKPFIEMIHPDDLPGTGEAIAKLKEGQLVVRFENRYLHRDGNYLWLEWNAVPDEKGELIYAAARNVTERKQMENELRRSNAELEQFAYVASHDLREPLRMVTSFVQLLKRRYGGALGADADEYIGHAVEGTERMRRMIEGLLQMSRVERRGRRLEIVDSAIPLEESLDSLSVSIKESGTVIHRPDNMPAVRGDSAQIAQLFQNLITNAIKSVEKGISPEITIETRRKANFQEFSIKDNGCGIARENHEKIFHIFHRLDLNDNKGCGIGLPLCRRIVERHGGTLTLKSEPKKGSVFFFTLPIA